MRLFLTQKSNSLYRSGSEWAPLLFIYYFDVENRKLNWWGGLGSLWVWVFFFFLDDGYLAKKTTIGRCIISTVGRQMWPRSTIVGVGRGWDYFYAWPWVVVLWFFFFFWVYRNKSWWLTRSTIVIFSRWQWWWNPVVAG